VNETEYRKAISVQFSRSVVSNSLRPHGPLSITNSQSLLKLLSIESMMPSNHLILCRPLLLPPSVFSSIRDFSNESVLCIRCPKYWSFSFNISPSNEYSGLISFRMDWLDLLAVQRTLQESFSNTTVQKPSILWHSAFFMVQLSHPYMTTEKPYMALTRWTFVGKEMSLLFNMPSKLVIAFLPRKAVWKISKTESWFFRKSNRISKSLAKLSKKKRLKLLKSRMKKRTTDLTEIKRIRKEYSVQLLKQLKASKWAILDEKDKFL